MLNCMLALLNARPSVQDNRDDGPLSIHLQRLATLQQSPGNATIANSSTDMVRHAFHFDASEVLTFPKN